MKFPCTSCGCCCKRIHLLKDQLEQHGLSIKEDGSCIHLDDNNLCKIYETRPPICRIGYSKPQEMLDVDYWKLTASICNAWQEQDNVPVQLRIII